METPSAEPSESSPITNTTKEIYDWRAIKFHATGSEYFRIWIVNLVLSIFTLGIYSAWATVRSRRYLYGNVEVAESRFDFHGKPLSILIGRIIAVILLLAWVQGDYLHYSVPLIALGVIIVFFPWFLTRAISFKLRNTSLRNLRFNFLGSTAKAYSAFWVYLVLAAALIAIIGYVFYSVTLGVDPDAVSEMDFASAMMVLGAMGLFVLSLAFLFPAFVCDLRRFTADYSSYGNHQFSVRLSKGHFIGIFWAALLILIITSLVVGALTFKPLMNLVAGVEDESSRKTLVLLAMGMSFYFIFYICFLVAQAFWQAKTFNLVFESLELANVKFRSGLKALPLAGILLSNTILIILTLGFAFPWAKVRLMRYKMQAIEYQGSADVFSGVGESDNSALGDEVGEAFDLDFGLGI